MKQSEEQAIKRSILNWAEVCRKDLFLFPIKNLGTPIIKGGQFVGFKRGMLMRGVSDLLAVQAPSGRLIALEVKTESGLKKYHSQKDKPYTTEWYEAEFLRRIIEMGGCGIVATCWEDVETEIDKKER